MSRLRRGTAAVGTTAFLLASSVMFAMPGSAAAAESLVAGSCGATLKGEAGTPVTLDLASALGISGAPTISLGTAPDGTKTFSVTGSELLEYVSGLPLLGKALPSVCEVTVTGVNTAAEPVQEATKEATDAAKSVTEPVEDAAKTLTDTVEGAVGGGSDDPPKKNEPSEGGDPGSKSNDNQPDSQAMPPPNSAPVGGWSTAAGLPYNLTPMSAFSPFRYTRVSFNAAPGLRYGTGFPGYSPEFGMLGEDGSQQGQGSGVTANAGSAQPLPSYGGAVGLPVLLAVLAVAAAGGGLVRTWVLRQPQ